LADGAEAFREVESHGDAAAVLELCGKVGDDDVRKAA